MKEAMFWERMDNGKVSCGLCRHHCVIAEGKTGIGGVRQNKGGILYTHAYGRAISAAVDPIEKKPLYHFLPGTGALSIATVGCNFRCLHCQNYQISQAPRMGGRVLGDDMPPQRVVTAARESGCDTISYTYTEPTIFFEYAYDTAKLAVEAGLKNTFVTNGYITPVALRKIRPFLHAANIDLKFFTEQAYQEICGARLQPVLDAIQLYHDLGIWIEITTLIIPNHNDSDHELRQIAEFVAGVDPTVPWHISAYHPAYKLKDQPRTPREVIDRARELGLAAGLKYVYPGNVIRAEGQETSCPSCGTTVIERLGYRILVTELKDGKCGKCGEPIQGVWK